MAIQTSASASGPAKRIAPWTALGTMERLATVARFKKGETLYYPEAPADYWYRIVTGAARKCAMSADGRRRIVDFLLPDDLFGFGTHDTHSFSVEVITEGTTVARYPRWRVERLAESDREIARRIREMAFESIAGLQRRMVILGRTSAIEKVVAFLLEMADRRDAGPANVVDLPMSRYDIADYLAMAVETVSRAFTQLRERGLIAFSDVRRVRICDRRALEQLADQGWQSRSVIGVS